MLAAVDNLFIRGSVVRFIQIDPKGVDTDLLMEAARREATQQEKNAKKV